MGQSSMTAVAVREDAIDQPSGVRVVVVGSGALSEALVRLLSRHGVAARRSPETTFSRDAAHVRPSAVVFVAEPSDVELAVARHHGARVVVCGTVTGRDDVVHVDLSADPSHLVAAVTGTRPLPVRPHATAAPRPGRPGGVLAELTAREREVLQLLMAGRSSAAIAEHLGISPHTVRTHVQNILGKLGVRTRLQAATVGHRAGLRPLEDDELRRARARRGARRR